MGKQLVGIKFERLQLKILKETPGNPQTMTDEEFSGMVQSMKRQGWLLDNPVVWLRSDNEYQIISGHHRVSAAIEAGILDIDCKVLTGLIPEQADKLVLEANQRRGQFDDKLLNYFIDNMIEEHNSDIDVLSEEIGLSDEQINEIFNDDSVNEKDDEIPEIQETAYSKTGDIYLLGNHRVLCGDSTKIEDVELLMDGSKADLLLTDPPYNVNYVGKTKQALRIKNDNKDNDSFVLFLEDSFRIAFDNIKLGASYYIWHADIEGYNFRGAVLGCGITVRQCLIWNKNSMVLGRQDYHWKHEPCLYGWKDGGSHHWNGDRKQATVINFDKPARSELHPTMKPVELYEYCIKNSSKGEDIILDSFLGSGTSVISSEKTKRICYGMELDPHYIDVIVKRYIQYTESNNNCYLLRDGKKTPLNEIEVFNG